MKHRILCLGALTLAAATPGPGPAQAALTVEPSPPELIDLALLEGLDRNGRGAVSLAVRPGLETEATLDLIPEGGARVTTPGALARRRLTPHEVIRPERISIEAMTGSGAAITARLTLLGPGGEPQMIIDRTLSLQPSPERAAQALVPLVRTLPDGSRLVERLPREEAEHLERLGLGTLGAPPPVETDAPLDEGGDPSPVAVFE